MLSFAVVAMMCCLKFFRMVLLTLIIAAAVHFDEPRDIAAEGHERQTEASPAPCALLLVAQCLEVHG